MARTGRPCSSRSAVAELYSERPSADRGAAVTVYKVDLTCQIKFFQATGVGDEVYPMGDCVEFSFSHEFVRCFQSR